MGCGEGWLAKASTKCLGVDVVSELIECAKKEGGGTFKSLSFGELTFDALKEKFDVVVCNFSLLGNESVIHLFRQAPSLLNERGALIIQTVHPVAGCGDGKYEDGWREGSWAGFSNKFVDPAPWYFRTMESWKLLFVEHGFTLKIALEPVNPKTQNKASVIFVAVKGKNEHRI